MADAEACETKMSILKSSDEEEFQVEEVVAMESQTIRHMIDDGCANNKILLPIINSKILSMVIEYCKKHIQAKPTTDTTTRASEAYDVVAPAGPVEDLKNWDAEFVRVNESTLFDLAMAARYLNIKGLLDLTTETLADMIKGKNSEKLLGGGAEDQQ
ncbi:SKP1-like protein 1 [Triticum dicoccoides]|uniref:SKP1-like protein 1 n=1 Tax=Triticum dicoccoides TaxID=85692 RepID=UPI00188F2E78|nr:SKP1-like protein 1 [Triticum dicoccoides]